MGGSEGVATQSGPHLFGGMRYLVAKIQMELLEICRNLMSSIQNNRFKGHFKFRMKALVGEERGDHGCRVCSVVVCKLSQGKEVDPFCLSIGLWMIGGREVG